MNVELANALGIENDLNIEIAWMVRAFLNSNVSIEEE
jgi:hypothetical protein